MALPITSQRAALAAAHPVHLVEPEAAALERLPARSPTHPFSCSTNLANDVTDHLRQAKLTASAWEVCAYLQRQTFGNAGWHRKRGQPETQCAFDLAAWAAAIPCDRSNLRRTLATLATCQIIWLVLDPARPGSGLIGWQLDFAHWQPYDQRRQPSRKAPERGRASAMSQQQASMVKCSDRFPTHLGFRCLVDHTCLL